MIVTQNAAPHPPQPLQLELRSGCFENSPCPSSRVAMTTTDLPEEDENRIEYPVDVSLPEEGSLGIPARYS